MTEFEIAIFIIAGTTLGYLLCVCSAIRDIYFARLD